MVEIAGDGGIDQVAATNFERNFLVLAQQKQSRLEASGVVRFLPTDGKYNTLPRMGKLELTEVNQRNPLKQYADYSVDNRMLRKRRFTATVLLDEKGHCTTLGDQKLCNQIFKQYRLKIPFHLICKRIYF